MIYSTGIYGAGETGDVIESSSIIEGKDDFIFKIYDNEVRMSLRRYTWEFFVYNTGWTLLDSGMITNGTLAFNLNDYGIQYEDNKFKVVITNKNTNTIVNYSEFWYSVKTYLTTTDEYWIEKKIIDWLEGGSGAVIPDNKRNPVVSVKNVTIDDKKFFINIVKIGEE